MKYKTPLPKVNTLDAKWYLIDAAGQTVGRLASVLAHRLVGKSKTDYTPHLVTSDFYIVINADKVVFSGKKMDIKNYITHSRYLGGIKSIAAKDKHTKDPCAILTLAVRGMLPKNKLREKMLARLKVIAGAEHPFAAQQPITIQLNN